MACKGSDEPRGFALAQFSAYTENYMEGLMPTPLLDAIKTLLPAPAPTAPPAPALG